jgi:NUMOD4 motif.
MNEVWKDIYLNGHLSNYQVSNFGAVKNKLTDKCLTGNRTKHNHIKYHLMLFGEDYYKVAHCLVAEYFVPNDDSVNKKYVKFIDENVFNIQPSNLQWITHSEIERYHELSLPKVYTRQSDNHIHKICKMLEQEYSYGYISEKLNIPRYLPGAITRRGVYYHIASQYKIPNFRKYDHKISPRITNIDLIHNICKLLSEYKTNAEIVKELNVKNHIVQNIRIRLNWKHISKDYVFPERIKGYKKEKKNDT